jgi:hypothetical protein
MGMLFALSLFYMLKFPFWKTGIMGYTKIKDPFVCIFYFQGLSVD